ncbi:MAG: DEAD/DEAH box helicase [bacterium]|nr:DEAD/DEAH box helicase [bacterium]
MVFELLHPKIREGLQKLGIKEPLETQRLAIPEILAGKHVLLIAPTGAGKTEAAVLPAFHLLLTKYKDIPGIKVLYITPLRSLNRDLHERLKFWEEQLGIKIAVRHGDTPVKERGVQVRKPPDMLIITPETLQAILPGKRLRELLKHVKIVVIDELHELLDSKRGVQLTLGLERLVLLAGEFQRIALSATIGNPELAAKFIFGEREHSIIQAYLDKQYKIKIVYPGKPGELATDVLARLEYIIKLIQKYRKVLIFCNTRTTAEVLAHRLSLLCEKEVAVHHSSLSKYVRLLAEEQFRKGQLQVVVATSSLELGIDIGDIELVIQYKSPKQVTRLLQRVGRAGHRITEVSRGIVIAEDFDDVVEASAITQLAKEGYLEQPEIHYGALDVLAHQVAGIIMDLGMTNIAEVYQLVSRAYPYKDLAPEKLEDVVRFLASLGYLRYYEDGNIKKSRKTWKYYYFHLSMIPEESKYEVVDKSSGISLGFLDEEFVAEYGIPGQKIIHKGCVWRIVEIAEDKIYVVPEKDIEGAIPTWVGEELPVPFEVAQTYAEIIEGKRPLAFCSKNARKHFEKILEQQAHYALPGKQRLIVEFLPGKTVLHCPFGYKVNNTLSKILSSYIVKYLHEPVLLRFDPYRIVIFKEIDPVKILREIVTKEEMFALLYSEVERTSFFKWRFANVCKRFGIIRSYKEARRKVEKLIEYLRDSIVYEEAMNEVLLEKFDTEKAYEIIQNLRAGILEVVRVSAGEPSPLAQLALRAYKIELHKPKDLQQLVLRFFVHQLQNRPVKLRCRKCGREYIVKIKEAEPKCICGSVEFDIFFDEKEEQKLSRQELDKRCQLFSDHGRKALYILAAGVEPLPELLVLDEKELLKKLVELVKIYKPSSSARMYGNASA